MAVPVLSILTTEFVERPQYWAAIDFTYVDTRVTGFSILDHQDPHITTWKYIIIITIDQILTYIIMSGEGFIVDLLKVLVKWLTGLPMSEEGHEKQGSHFLRNNFIFAQQPPDIKHLWQIWEENKTVSNRKCIYKLAVIFINFKHLKKIC